jgi:hypothetical protein
LYSAKRHVKKGGNIAVITKAAKDKRAESISNRYANI